MKVKMKKQILVLMTLILGVMVFGGLVMAAEATAPTSAGVTIPGFISISLDPSSIDFGSLNAGDLSETKNLTVTIGSTTNVNVQVLTKATSDFVSGAFNFVKGNMEWWTDTEHPSWNDYTGTDAQTCASKSRVIGNENCTIIHQLHVPFPQHAGDYRANITITGKEAATP